MVVARIGEIWTLVKFLIRTTIVALVIGLAVLTVNYGLVHRHMVDVLNSDERNSGITVWTHYANYVNPGVLVFDLREVSLRNSHADVFRVLLQFSKSMDDQTFDKVILAYTGESKFYIEGEFFQSLGHEYGTQNPVYTMRTFPENVYDLDGRRAFDTWTGGWLGVMNRQLDDFNELHERWYGANM